MSKTRTGKIARLPRTVRGPLNQRLHDGEPGKRLLAWLNALPAAQAVLAAEFEGRPINAQNLSDWKQGGYRDWVAQQEALELAGRLAEDGAELQAEGQPPLTDTLALWLAARYAVATRRVAEAESAEGWRLLRELCGDIVELRRGDHSAERLWLERERLELERAQSKEHLEKRFWEWAQAPENKAKICGPVLTYEERRRAIAEIYGRPLPEPETDAEAETECPAAPGAGPPDSSNQGESSPIKADGSESPAQAESNPVKPDQTG